MSTSTLSNVRPILGVPDGKSSADPLVRERWLDQRRGGITATEIRDWGNGAKRRDIIVSKCGGGGEDLNHIPAVRHGNLREPLIADWVQSRFGITPCDNVYSHGVNTRHLASPDGISLDPFSGELIVGNEDAILCEIKTSKNDMNPGRLDAGRVLLEIDPSSNFSRANYYTQIQWQLYVMNATMCLFVWEQHDNIVNSETGTFTPIGVPEYAWIPRDQKLIDTLVNDVAPKALEEIDAARVTAAAGAIPPVAEGLDTERSALVAELLAARDAEAVAKKRKEAAWAKLSEHYLGEGKQDFTVKIPGFANVTVSTSNSTKSVVDEEGMRRKAPTLVQKYEALRKRYTKSEPVSSQKLTVTANKG